MPPGSYAFRMNVPVGGEDDGDTFNIPVDAAISTVVISATRQPKALIGFGSIGSMIFRSSFYDRDR